MITIIIIVVVLFAIIMIVGSKADKEQKENIQKVQSAVPEQYQDKYLSFSSRARLYYNRQKETIMFATVEQYPFTKEYTECYVTNAYSNLNGIITLFDDKREFCFIIWESNNTNKHTCKVIYYKDIISVSVDVDGVTEYSKQTGRVIGGAIAGKMLMGNAGAVIGALSSSSVENKKIKSIKIKLLLRSTSTPSFTITAFESNIAKETKYLSNELKFANNLKDVFSVIIDKESHKQN